MGELAALVAALTWSATSVVLTSLSARTSPVALSALRLSAATLVLPFILLFSGQAGDISAAPWTAVAAMIGSGFIGYAVGDTLYIRSLGLLGMQKTFPISMALFISLTVLGGILLLDEPFKWTLLLGAVLIGAGVYFIVIPRRGTSADRLVVPSGAEPALASMVAVRAGRWPARSVALRGPVAQGYIGIVVVGVLWAAASLWLAVGREDLGAVAAGALRTPAGAVGMVAFGLATRPRELIVPFADRRHIGAIVLAGLVGTAFGSLLYVYAVGEAGAARTAVLSAASPLMALPLSVIFLKEPLTGRILAGTVLCVGGIGLVVS
ncbi:MAG TPA: DMT family transporter [Tepidiformaceae bacterium]|nr:DMT family transporter [Tepidiformaceae bacterium]